VSQHHHGRQKQGGGVGKLLASDIGRGSVDGLEDGALVSDVARGSETKTTDQTSTHIGQNVSVQVGHDQDLVVVGERVGNHLQACVVQQLGVKLNVGEFLGDLTGSAQEETVGHLHDGGLVDSAHLLAADVAGVLEGVAQDALRGFTGDELDALHHAVNHHVLNARVFSLGVLADQDRVDIVIGRLEADNGSAGSHVGEEVEGSAEGQVERDVALADGRCEGTLESDVVLLDAGNGLVGDDRLAVLEARGHVDGLPLDGHVGGRVNVLDRLRNLRADTVALDERHRELPVVALGALEQRYLLVLLGGGVASRLRLDSISMYPVGLVRRNRPAQARVPISRERWPGAGIAARGMRKRGWPAW